MKARLAAFLIWAVVAASVMFWILRLGVSSPAAPGHTVAVGAATSPRGDLSRLLGAAPAGDPGAVSVPAQTPLSSRFKLLGVAAPRQGGDRIGLALIAVDGKPARSYVVGAAVDGDMVLQSVHARGAKLGARDAVPQVTLDLPALPLPATGTLPLAPPPGQLPVGGAPGTPPPVPPAALGSPIGVSGAPPPPAVSGTPPAAPTETQLGVPVAVPPAPGTSPR
jgi:general secretion pathway protein C